MINSTVTNFSSPEFFDAKYLNKADPWNFSSDAYELARYEQIISPSRTAATAMRLSLAAPSECLPKSLQGTVIW
ncbi:hypothetical protein HDF16_005266 [Granulicella aggregans]|uniref:Uncharacterized protein n=1 Tax=Granulicella aggregans TaxID=474949 RepID=A0A7W8E7Q8_9BACT|nr:hypothetical protein [Granulicella aggregans]